MSAVFESLTLGPTDRLVLLSLADHAGEDGTCYPSIARLCQRTGLGERAVQQALKRLREAGKLTAKMGGGRGNSTLYTITLNTALETPFEKPRFRNPVSNDINPAFNALNPARDAPEPSVTIIEPSVGKKRDVAATLEAWASPKAVSSFLAYRRKSKAGALTETGAARMATHLKAIFDAGFDPDDALGMAEQNGWRAVEASWYFKRKAEENGNGNRTSKQIPNGGKRIDPALEQIARLTGLDGSSGNGGAGTGDFGEEVGSFRMGARPQ